MLRLHVIMGTMIKLPPCYRSVSIDGTTQVLLQIRYSNSILLGLPQGQRSNGPDNGLIPICNVTVVLELC